MKLFHQWLQTIGVSKRTGREWEKAGFLTTEKRYGRRIISEEEIQRFFHGDPRTDLVKLGKWLQGIGYSDISGQRWEVEGLSVLRVRGQKFVSLSEATEFLKARHTRKGAAVKKAAGYLQRGGLHLKEAA